MLHIFAWQHPLLEWVHIQYTQVLLLLRGPILPTPTYLGQTVNSYVIIGHIFKYGQKCSSSW